VSSASGSQTVMTRRRTRRCLGGKKDVTQCRRVYTAMVSAVDVAGQSWIGATVNLRVSPTEPDGLFAPLPGGDTGECSLRDGLCKRWEC